MDSLPAILTAVALVVTAAASAIAAWRSGTLLKKTETIVEKATKIEDATNGAAHQSAADKRALEEKVDRLQTQLAEVAAAAKASADAAREAAADVRAERAAPSPVQAKGGK